MRIGAVYVPSANAYYRAVEPLKAMARRGHEIVWPPETGHAEAQRLARCDVVHVYRLTGPKTRRVLEETIRRGVGLTYDNDDDYTTVPKESPQYRSTGGLAGQRAFGETVKLARMAYSFTTTTEVLAAKYQRAGVDRVHVIENCVAPDLIRARNPHQGVVIGWVAGMEHLADVARIPIRDALQRLLDQHQEVRVECIGVDLGLSGNYHHDRFVDFLELPHRIAGFDVGLAPLADIPCNWARSNIKVKEYAAAGVPWLASPLGAYEGLGEAQGGRLVPDDGWFEALERLVSRRRERLKLAKKAGRWGKRQTVDAVADRWEQVFEHAAK